MIRHILTPCGAILVAILATVQVSNVSAQTAPYANPEVIAEGKLIYDGACASCHGGDLEGQPNWRQRGANGRLPAPPHDITGHTWHHADEQLFAITKYGTEALVGGDYKSDMRGFEGELTDAQIKAVLAYIKSTWPEDIQERHSAMSR
ncbi:Cytochrome C oxidase, cbb3-type, subunit III [Litoreibacter ascidiaceicola]|uniref:Cytochrome C oxidase, cbb3-type, subunit III n=1 Tax=Litoreibacter ascidiaceicola TaxID=1486859 RepID=A0A1M4XEA4_9RHOB|nr:cytochrome c [Litoreibacter ascidiaceicola]SHE91670.1 Cytochrome C oxidase, cbb3-type, subunit III [Litoreibacter ascidiaceicola]